MLKRLLQLSRSQSFFLLLSLKPKFYFFDVGIVRALTRMLSAPLRPSTSMYGEIFEHFIIIECLKLASYFHQEYRFSYLQTKDGVEIDLVVERPGLPLLFIEIKSSKNIKQDDLRSFINLLADFKEYEVICLSNDFDVKKFDNITVLPWQQGLQKYFMV